MSESKMASPTRGLGELREVKNKLGWASFFNLLATSHCAVIHAKRLQTARAHCITNVSSRNLCLRFSFKSCQENYSIGKILIWTYSIQSYYLEHQENCGK